MIFFRMFRWGLVALSMCFFGCSSLHVDVGSTFDWNSVSAVSLQNPPQDPWLLATAIRTELQKMGLTVLSDDRGNPDLTVRFFFKEGLDLDSNGNQFTRLKSLHIQFVDPATETFVAVADYFYADSPPDPVEGVEAAFAGIHEGIGTNDTLQLQAKHETSAKEIATSPATAPSLNQQGNPPIVVNENSALEQNFNHQGSVRLNDKVASTISLSEQRPQPITPVIDKSKVPTIESKTQSPWIPRFKSWGFESWGEESGDDN